MKTPKQLALSYDDIQLVPHFSTVRSRLDVYLESKLGPYSYNPILTAPMDTVSSRKMMEVCEATGTLGVVHRFQSLEDRWAELPETGYHAVAIGLNDEYEDLLTMLKRKPAHLCFDIANSGTSYAVEYCSGLLKYLDQSGAYGNQLIVGNVCTGRITKILLKEIRGYNGRNQLAAIKVGIGGGAVCSTRGVTGFGVPQVTAILECREAVDEYEFRFDGGIPRVRVIADGAIKGSGDIAKALACGADFVMIGGLLAGTAEAPGELTRDLSLDSTGALYKQYRGMASKEAQEAHAGPMKTGIVPEGVSHLVPYKGPAKNVIENLLGGLRSAFTYAGARTVEEFYRNTEFVQITNAGHAEAKTRIL